MELDIDAVITPIPTGCELLLGLPTLLDSGLLTAVMAGMTEQTSAAGVPDSRNEDGDPLETWESIDRADEREQDMIMPTVGGTIRCGEGGHTDRAEQVQAHFRQAADRGFEA